MTQQLIAVDAQALEKVMDRLKHIENLLRSTTITPPAKWITVAEYAKRVGKSEATVRRWNRDGQLERKQRLVRNPDA
jgi:hypothetical protein